MAKMKYVIGGRNGVMEKCMIFDAGIFHRDAFTLLKGSDRGLEIIGAAFVKYTTEGDGKLFTYGKSEWYETEASMFDEEFLNNSLTQQSFSY